MQQESLLQHPFTDLTTRKALRSFGSTPLTHHRLIFLASPLTKLAGFVHEDQVGMGFRILQLVPARKSDPVFLQLNCKHCGINQRYTMPNPLGSEFVQKVTPAKLLHGSVELKSLHNAPATLLPRHVKHGGQAIRLQTFAHLMEAIKKESTINGREVSLLDCCFPMSIDPNRTW